MARVLIITISLQFFDETRKHLFYFNKLRQKKLNIMLFHQPHVLSKQEIVFKLTG